ncbi:MAG: hypothetical protein QME58_13295 [Bacteroidota bacterium]|nr:hypothetical protein [Bacteroidota bacterium]
MKNFTLIVLVILSLHILGCSHTQNLSSRFNVTLTSGGGFTGMYNGYYIDTLGEISRWEGRTYNLASLKPGGKLTPDKLKEMNTKITELELLNVQYNKSGNISSSISISTNISKHTVSWVGVEPEEEVPEKIKEFYYYIKNLINNSITK